jgi:ADP-heptose:LPS heptosyltransferase
VSARAIAVPAGGFRHVAVIRLSSLGDVVLTLPVVHALRRAYPQARIAFWTKQEYADVVRFDPAVTHARLLEPDARRIEDLVSMSAELEDADLVVDLHRNARSRVLTFRLRAPVLRAPAYRLLRERWVHARWTRPRPALPALARYAAALAPLRIEVPEVPRVQAGAEAEAWADATRRVWDEADRDASPRRIAVCPGARHATKRWPEEHWLTLHERLSAAGHRLVYFSTPAERLELSRLASRVTEQPRATWHTEPVARVAALLSRCHTAVTCDSGLMHLAAARGLKLVALFGSTSPELGFAPAGEGHAVLCRREPCQPCTLHGLERCPRRHFRCMRELLPDSVEAAIRERLS